MGPVLIAGARGFIGRHLSRYLSALEIPVVGVGHGAIVPAGLEQFGLKEWLDSDLDYPSLELLGKRHGPFRCIINLAGGSHVGGSFENPAEDFSRTVTAASHLLEWMRLNAGETPLVVVSSAAVYGAGHSGPIAEDANLAPFSPYGAHKAMLESLSRSYGQNFGLNISICRLFSVYGEGLEKQLLFDLCRKAAQAATRGEDHITLGGSGEEIRDWLHVSDAVRLLWLMKDHAGTTCPVANGGSGVGTSVAEVARRVLEALNVELELSFDGLSRRGDPASLVADVDKASSLGFATRVSIDDGFRRVADWFRAADPSTR